MSTGWTLTVGFSYVGTAADADDPPRHFEKDFPDAPGAPSVGGVLAFAEIDDGNDLAIVHVAWWPGARRIDIELDEMGPDEVDPSRLRAEGWTDTDLYLYDELGDRIIPGGPNDPPADDDENGDLT